MKIQLFPFEFKYAGWLLLIIGLVMGYLVTFNHFMPDFLDVPVFAIYSAYIQKTVMGFTQTNLADEIAIIFILAGLAIFTFSKQKEEKSFYMNLRAESLFLSLAINTACLILLTLLVFGLGYIKIVFLNIFSIFIIYLIVFNLKLAGIKRTDQFN